MLTGTGCSSTPQADGTTSVSRERAETLPSASPVPAAALPAPSGVARRAVDAEAACVQFARAAAEVDTRTASLGQTRQAAARAYGTPQLQALYDGPGQGRDRELETWQQHRARITVTAVPVAGDFDEHDDTDASGVEAPSGTPVAVAVTGIARGADGWSAPTAPYRLDCLTVQDPVAGWLVDDVAVSTFATTPAAG